MLTGRLMNSFGKAAVNYMRTNPDRFIGHVTDQSWVSYLNTLCDHLDVQAVSDALNVTIHITKSITVKGLNPGESMLWFD